LGPVQLLVNNAGVSTLGMRFEEVGPELWDRVVDINLTGAYNGVHYFLPHMRAGGRGHIVNVASAAGLYGSAALAPYCATKFALIGLSEVLHEELAGEDIGVSVVCAGGVRTRLWRTSRVVKGLPDIEEPPLDGSAQSARAAVTADEVGQRVLAAVLNNELYVQTDSTLRGPVIARHERLVRSIDAADAFAVKHGQTREN